MADEHPIPNGWREVGIEDRWSMCQVAATGDLVYRQSVWIEGSRVFIASRPGPVFVEDPVARADLQAVIDKWTGEGKHHLVELLTDDCSDDSVLELMGQWVPQPPVTKELGLDEVRFLERDHKRLDLPFLDITPINVNVFSKAL